jgi:hypothetical protein
VLVAALDGAVKRFDGWRQPRLLVSVQLERRLSAPDAVTGPRMPDDAGGSRHAINLIGVTS